jgi:hypothetical protein
MGDTHHATNAGPWRKHVVDGECPCQNTHTSTDTRKVRVQQPRPKVKAK